VDRIRTKRFRQQKGGAVAMDKNLERLIELSKDIEMTEEEQEEQRRSFAYGNARIENENITRASIDKAAEELLKTPKDDSK
jgi:Fic family protein